MCSLYLRHYGETRFFHTGRTHSPKFHTAAYNILSVPFLTTVEEGPLLQFIPEAGKSSAYILFVECRGTHANTRFYIHLLRIFCWQELSWRTQSRSLIILILGSYRFIMHIRTSSLRLSPCTDDHLNNGRHAALLD